MIHQRNISRLSNRLAASGGRRIPEAVLERDYCIAWLLVGMAKTKLPNLLAFKGGTALKRCYFGDYRWSEDLDFTLMPGADLSKVMQELEAAYIETNRQSGIAVKHSRAEPSHGLNSHTFYIAYEGPLPTTIRAKEIKVDITLKEALVFNLESKSILRGYDEFEDLPENKLITAYSLEEIATEKTVALFDPARTEPRDLYDLWFLIAGMHIDFQQLAGAIETKLNFRGKKLQQVAGNLKSKEHRYNKLWSTRLENQMVVLPHFEEAYRVVRRAMRQTGLLND